MRVHLYRDSFDTPWGFRLQGGKDLSQPLVVQRVFSNTPAEGELQRGDIILSINGRDTQTFTHKQAQDQIKFGGGQIELLVDRPSVTSIKPLNPNVATRAPSNIPPPTTSPIVIPIRKAPDTGPKFKSNTMPHPGHKPTKITLNKYGGGSTSFGASYGKAPTPPAPSYSSQQYSNPTMIERVQGSLDSALSPTYHVAQPQFQQYSAPQPKPQQQVPAVFSYGVPKTTSAQIDLQNAQPDYVRSSDPLEEEDYNYVPVSQRKHQFTEKPQKPAQLKSGRKAPVPFRPQSSEYSNFGVDYSSVKPAHQQQAPSQPVQKPRPPPATASRQVHHAQTHDDYTDANAPWSNTLRSSNVPKPWELEQQDYIMPAERPPPRVSPKPAVKPPSAAPSRQITVRSVSNEGPSPPEDDGPRVVHLQYNSPMGLYSSENIKETYKGQTEGLGHPSSTKVEQKNGDRDWNDSYVYRMLHEEDRPRQPPATSPKPVHHARSPQQQQTYDTFDGEYGTSDF